MNRTTISADFSQLVGSIKPMHGGNIGPLQDISGNTSVLGDFTSLYREMGVPYCRVHDVEIPFGKDQFVDIHGIFQDFDADVNDPASYNFKYTDIYLKGIIDAGSEVFYRLGESIDGFDRKLYVNPPKDFEKWANICEHIIAHYNEGWANGYKWGIRYWEIWGEPENGDLFTGTREEYYDLYRITARRLKARFGDSIRIGGYGSCGFYALTRDNPSEWFKTLIPFMDKFFEYITAEETKAPIDFFSWHIYAESLEELTLHASFARKKLDSFGLLNCESILDEFNFFYTFSEFAPFHKGVFADLASGLILAQKSSIDKMMHYAFTMRTPFNEMFSLGYDNQTIHRFAGIESYSAFNTLYKLGNEVQVEGDIPTKLDVLAATDETGKAAMFISSHAPFDEIEIKFANYPSHSYVIKRVTDGAEGMAVIKTENGTLSADGLLTTSIKEHETLLICFANQYPL